MVYLALVLSLLSATSLVWATVPTQMLFPQNIRSDLAAHMMSTEERRHQEAVALRELSAAFVWEAEAHDSYVVRRGLLTEAMIEAKKARNLINRLPNLERVEPRLVRDIEWIEDQEREAKIRFHLNEFWEVLKKYGTQKAQVHMEDAKWIMQFVKTERSQRLLSGVIAENEKETEEWRKNGWVK